jgi:hypothetical protein
MALTLTYEGTFAEINQRYGEELADRHVKVTLEEQPHLPQYTKDHWSDRLPPIWSEHTIYPQTAMEVMRFMGRPDTIDYGAFYASMLVNEPHLSRYLLPFLGRFLSQKPQSSIHFASLVVKKLIGRIRRDFRSRISGLPFQLSIFETPDACMRHLTEYKMKPRS